MPGVAVSAAAAPLVLHVIHHLVVGGMENGLVNLINRMPPQRLRHMIVCVEDHSDFSQRIQRPDVEVLAMHRSRIGIWSLRRRLLALCRRVAPTIVHTRGPSGLDALLPARLAGVRHTVHGEHGWDVADLHGKSWKPVLLRRLHAPLVSRYVTVSKDLQRYLVERVGIAERRITQIYNGVDTDQFHPGSGGREGLFPPGFANPEAIVVGTVGRIQPVKDQATLLRAFAELLRQQPEFAPRLRLVMVGDGPLMRDLRDLAATLRVAEKVWMPGAVSNVAELMRGMDLFVLPSLNEGISNTILEAMASGLPVIATAVGGNVELIDEGRTGRLFAPQDVPALTRLLADYVVDAQLRRQHAQAARETAVERFGLAAMVSSYLALYERLAGTASA
jgi:sugar transferase (PEP-CTERM/EpsH1 system associated)